MQALKAILQEAMESAFVEAGYDKDLGKVSVSNRPDLCDYQSNGALVGAKKYQENPIALAEKVKGFLEKKSYKNTPLFSSVEAVKPGFLNVKLSPEFLGAYLWRSQCGKASSCRTSSFCRNRRSPEKNGTKTWQ